jgi:hypothetical protein
LKIPKGFLIKCLRTVTLRAGTVILPRASLFWENTILLALLRTVALNEEPLHCQLSVSVFWENTLTG